jgi:hypothetical protein
VGGIDWMLGRAPSAEVLLSDPAWFLHDLDFARGQAVFTRTNRAAVAAQPFLDSRWSRVGAALAALPLERLAEARPPERPPALVWHTAFCCSTLIATCFDQPGKTLVLKEPKALVELATAKQATPPAADDALAAGVLRLLARDFQPGERVVIKPSNAANSLIAPLAAEAGPMLLLHSSLRWFLLSLARGGETRRAFVRPLLAMRMKGPAAARAAADLGPFSELAAAALLWRLQIAEFRSLATRFGPAKARMLDCEDFLAAPETQLTAIDAFLELGLGADHIAETVRGPRFLRHDNDPRAALDLNRHRATLAEVEARLGEELKAAIDWSAGAADRLREAG